MRNLKWAAIALLSSGIVFAGSASAADVGTCTHMATAVKSAIEANGSSANLADAQKEQSLGRDWCANGLYDRGISHYQHALDLLGVKN
jgi:hypothetical protein